MLAMAETALKAVSARHECDRPHQRQAPVVSGLMEQAELGVLLPTRRWIGVRVTANRSRRNASAPSV